MIGGKIHGIAPSFSDTRSKNLKLKDYDVILNAKMGERNSHDLREKVKPDTERFDLQYFLNFMRTVKARTKFTINYQEKEKDFVEITLQDIRKVYGRKMNVIRNEFRGYYSMNITVIL